MRTWQSICVGTTSCITRYSFVSKIRVEKKKDQEKPGPNQMFSNKPPKKTERIDWTTKISNRYFTIIELNSIRMREKERSIYYSIRVEGFY